MNIEIEKLEHTGVGKFQQLIRLFEDVFLMIDFRMPEETYLQQLLTKPDFFVFVALHDNVVVGSLTSYILQQYYSRSPLVYIFDLAVATTFQRQGIGKMLIAANNAYAQSIHAEAVMVQADEEDDFAIKFYQSTGGSPQNVIHFDYNLGGSGKEAIQQ